MKRAFPLAVFAALAACTAFPELDGTLPPSADAADYPRLVPVEPLLEAAQEVQITETTQSGIEARVAALKARAARLRGPIVDSTTRARMRAGVTGIVEQ